MKLKGQGKKEYIVVRREFDIKPWDGLEDQFIFTQKMTEKRAVETVLHYEKLGYYKVWMQKVITVKPQRI